MKEIYVKNQALVDGIVASLLVWGLAALYQQVGILVFFSHLAIVSAFYFFMRWYIRKSCQTLEVEYNIDCLNFNGLIFIIPFISTLLLPEFLGLIAVPVMMKITEDSRPSWYGTPYGKKE